MAVAYLFSKHKHLGHFISDKIGNRKNSFIASMAMFACMKKRSQNTVAAGCVREKYCSCWLINSATVRRNQPAGLETRPANGTYVRLIYTLSVSEEVSFLFSRKLKYLNI